jgi:hypothetical protein
MVALKGLTAFARLVVYDVEEQGRAEGVMGI